MRLKPKKSLGQNFLSDKNILAKIINACGLTPEDTVLEIGSGRGELTKFIAPRVKHLTALEIDTSLCEQLEGSLKEYKNSEIINCDVLKFNFKKYFRSAKIKRLKVIGNIPYYISTPIIEELLKHRKKIEVVFFTVQKEFADRIAARPGSKTFGSLSCFIQYYAEPEKLFLIKRNSFFPSPKVDSCLLRLKIRNKPTIKVRDEKFFFSIIRAAFNKRRKTLRNSLKDIYPSEKLTQFFVKYSITPNTRPECLSLEDFANLSNLQKT